MTKNEVSIKERKLAELLSKGPLPLFGHRLEMDGRRYTKKEVRDVAQYISDTMMDAKVIVGDPVFGPLKRHYTLRVVEQETCVPFVVLALLS